MPDRADLEKRLADEFHAVIYPAGDHTTCEMCARIAAEEIEKAEARGHDAGVNWMAEGFQKARMDAARKVRDWYEANPGMPAFLLHKDDDAALARIIGADGHEGGGEVSASTAGETNSSANAAQAAEPPRPEIEVADMGIIVRPAETIGSVHFPEQKRGDHACYVQGQRDGRREARAAAFEECAKIARSMPACGGDEIAIAIRAAARQGSE